MDWFRPILGTVNRRLGGVASSSWPLPLRRTVEAFTLVFFLAITSSIISQFLTNNALSSTRRSNCHFPAIFNFGDSNSDTGGKSAAFHRLPYPNGETFFHKPSGRYCDGKVIVDFIAEKLGLPYLSAYLDSIGTNFRHGANFATGGSTIQSVDVKVFEAGFSPISLEIQLLQFKQFKARSDELFNEATSSNLKNSLPRPEDFSKALYTFDIGQNDLHFGFKAMGEEQLKASFPKTIGTFAQAIKELYQLGARAFWIHNTGPIGCLPYTVIRNSPKPEDTNQNGCVKSHNEVAKEFNRQLHQRISQLRVQLPDAVITYVDIYSAKYSLISEAKKYGFANPLEQCCGHYRDYYVQCGKKAMVNGSEIFGNVCSDPSVSISWDGVHYSHAANRWVAHQIEDGSLSDPKISIAQACHNPAES
ncbi:GDSL esterase/lipase At5g14450-like [Humulus lupulus]|uniref:GDSL esterase/lipase At5g14450-like n=1 Tax=Humulus lupulus TaxID=3486 RepID=UPI002B40803E|nr:GDSL esterase/lipase At5g14450-like [Humulus lupulus]